MWWKIIHLEKQLLFLILSFLIYQYNALSQDILDNLLEILPLEFESGCWSIYEVKDNTTKTTFLLREAITGEELVENRKCFWLEAEVIPTVGFPSVYRFLILPEKDGKHKILKIVMREGANLPETYNSNSIQGETEKINVKKKFVKEEEIEYKTGKIKAKHYNIRSDDKELEIWTTSEIKPLGLVKLQSKDGEITLIRSGKGGAEAKSNLEMSTQKNMQNTMEEIGTTNTDIDVKINQGVVNIKND